MTIVKISKEKIIKAIEKEPLKTLRAGSWCGDGYSDDMSAAIKDSSKSCSVCAVGAVMRNVLLDKNQPIYMISDAAAAAVSDADPMAGFGSLTEIRSRALYQLRENKSPMAALSSYFEGVWQFYAEKALESNPECCYAEPSREDVKLIREKTVAFVKRHFPKHVEVDIDGAKPAKDVVVLRKEQEECV